LEQLVVGFAEGVEEGEASLRRGGGGEASLGAC